MVAALLHDAPEDQGGEAGCGTSAPGSATRWRRLWPAARTPSRPQTAVARRKEAYLAHLAETLRRRPPRLRRRQAPQRPRRPLRLRAVGEELWNRFNGKEDGTLWYYRALVEAYEKAGKARSRKNWTEWWTELERRAGVGEGGEKRA